MISGITLLTYKEFTIRVLYNCTQAQLYDKKSMTLAWPGCKWIASKKNRNGSTSLIELHSFVNKK